MYMSVQLATHYCVSKGACSGMAPKVEIVWDFSLRFLLQMDEARMIAQRLEALTKQADKLAPFEDPEDAAHHLQGLRAL